MTRSGGSRPAAAMDRPASSGKDALAAIVSLAVFVSVWTAFPVPALASPSASPPSSPSEAEAVRPGELARVHYVATIGEGLLVATSLREVAEHPLAAKMSWYRLPAEYGPVVLVAGSPSVFPGLGEAVEGMTPGERKRTIVPSEQAFGLPDSALVEAYPREQRVSRHLTLAPAEFVGRFGVFPVEGERLAYDEYLTAVILSVAPGEARLELRRQGPTVVESAIGTTEIETAADEIVIRLRPRLGAEWRDPLGRRGAITGMDERSFRVDYNHRLAGRPVTLDIELLGRASADSVAAAVYPWLDDHDAALAKAREERRPLVLLLYATWCEWSGKLIDETLEDPRVKVLRDRFVWAKIPSDLYSDIRQRYQQTGSPLIVLYNAAGGVSLRMEGFRDGDDFSRALQGCLTDW